MADASRDPADTPARGAARLIAAARLAEGTARLHFAGAVAELFKPEATRLTDYQRATVTHMLDALVDYLETALRQHAAAGLPPGAEAARAALETIRVPLARPLLDRAGLLRDAELVALLLRRAEEHRLGLALRLAAAAEPVPDPLATLLGDADHAIADAAAALAAAEARRTDRFRGPALAVADLPAELLHRLVWWLAAALRAVLTGPHALGEAAADAAIVPAATTILAAHDEDAGVDPRAMALARALAAADRLDDPAVRVLAEGGQLAALVAALAMRAQVDQTAAWDMTIAPDGDRLALLLRAAGVERTPAAAILLRLAPEDDMWVAAQLDATETLDPADAREALRLWRLDRGYRDAILALAAAGQGGGT